MRKTLELTYDETKLLQAVTQRLLRDLGAELADSVTSSTKAAVIATLELEERLERLLREEW